jgi:hypothetical protein
MSFFRRTKKPNKINSFDELENTYDLEKIAEKIDDDKKLSNKEVSVWQRAVLLSWSSDLREDFDTIKDSIYDKLMETCDVQQEEAASNWYHDHHDNYDSLFNGLFEFASLKEIACLGV